MWPLSWPVNWPASQAAYESRQLRGQRSQLAFTVRRPVKQLASLCVCCGLVCPSACPTGSDRLAFSLPLQLPVHHSAAASDVNMLSYRWSCSFALYGYMVRMPTRRPVYFFKKMSFVKTSRWKTVKLRPKSVPAQRLCEKCPCLGWKTERTTTNRTLLRSKWPC